jgi:hypothetical protein
LLSLILMDLWEEAPINPFLFCPSSRHVPLFPLPRSRRFSLSADEEDRIFPRAPDGHRRF